MARLITLTTDFGVGSSYVAAMKGVIWSAAPDAPIIDLTHSIPPQNLRAAALFLRNVLPWYPPYSIHVVVIDPGVGTDRAILLIEWRESYILAPDNGVWTLLDSLESAKVSRLDPHAVALHPTSATFHGRDIFAPAAGRLWNGLPVKCRAVSEWQTLALPTPVTTARELIGEVIEVDPFGNLITNIPRSMVAECSIVFVESQQIGQPSSTYGHSPPQSLIALFSSNGHLEIAVVNDSAAARLGLGLGAKVTVRPA